MRLRRTSPDDEATRRLARLLDPAQPGSSAWSVNRPVEPRPELDRLNGWVPEPITTKERRRRRPRAEEEPAPEREMDDLDRFLASAGLDGLTDVDDWNEPGEDARRDGWWSRLSVPWRTAVTLAVLGAVAVAVVGVVSLTGPRPGSAAAVPSRSAAGTTTSTDPAVSAAPAVSGAAASAPAATTPAVGASGTAAPATSAGGQVVVDVVGQVKRPGVVRLPVGSRVADAVTAAGGLAATADVQSLNLARVLQDGEQVRVPRPGETPAATAAPDGSSAAGSLAPSVGAATSPAASGGATPGMVNLNTATLAELDTLDGIGPALAQRIVDYRTAHGRFTSVDQLDDVSGIGEKLLARIRPQVTV